MKKTTYVDVFLGNGAVKTEPLEGIAATWHPIKAMTGNTTPAAQLPFGKLSVCSFSGAYPCGSGINRISSCPPCRFLYDKKKIYGMTHLRHSGTGAIGYYYNYALLWCGQGAFSLPALHDLADEAGCPGYYAATDSATGVRYEATTDALSARHRVHLPAAGGYLAVDFSNDGLYPGEENLRGTAGAATLTVADEHTVTAAVELRGVVLYFALHCTGASPKLWLNGQISKEAQLSTDGNENRRFGCVFDVTEEQVEAVLSISLRSSEKALRDNAVARETDFDAVRTAADEAWEDVLSRIEMEGSDREKRIFYSNLYHTLVKPADWSGESWRYGEDECVLDFATLWDIYKTQTPLVFSLYPEISRKMIASYCHFASYFGCMPNSIGVNSTLLAEANQALLLAGYLFSDAYYRGVPGIDWKTAFTLLDKEMDGASYERFFTTGAAARTTHTLDLAENCGNLSDICTELGLDSIAARRRPFARNWKGAFSPTDGLLLDGYEYYEGNRWNYSFRPLREMNERIADFSGREAFLACLDRFFGYTDGEDVSARFEGFNNETDMEAPYAYAYAGRHDRLCEIADACVRYYFTTGEGGIPGNNDSGGLSACFLWNAMGIFPVTGQDLMLVGSPHYKRVVFHLGNGKNFTVRRMGEGIYVKSVTLDGKPLTGTPLSFSVRRMMQGGELVVNMCKK